MNTRQPMPKIAFSTTQIKQLTSYLHYKLKALDNTTELTNGRFFFAEENSSDKEKQLLEAIEPILKHSSFTALIQYTLTHWPTKINSTTIASMRQQLESHFLNDLTTKLISRLLDIQSKIRQQFFSETFSSALMFAVIAHQAKHFFSISEHKTRLNFLKKILIFSNPADSLIRETHNHFIRCFNANLCSILSARLDKKTLTDKVQKIISNTDQLDFFHLVEDAYLRLWQHIHKLIVYLKLRQSREFKYLKLNTDTLLLDSNKWNLSTTETNLLGEAIAKAICGHIASSKELTKNEAEALLGVIDYLDTGEHKSLRKSINQAKTSLDAKLTAFAQQHRERTLYPEFNVSFSNRMFYIKAKRSSSDPQLVSPRQSPKNQD